MTHGGHRAGAGRKAGSATLRTREIADAVAAGGLTPLEFLTQVYRDENEEKARRIDAAKAAAQYVHAKLASIEGTLRADVSVATVTHKVIE